MGERAGSDDGRNTQLAMAVSGNDQFDLLNRPRAENAPEEDAREKAMRIYLLARELIEPVGQEYTPGYPIIIAALMCGYSLGPLCIF
jgi:hypothetical protein